MKIRAKLLSGLMIGTVFILVIFFPYTEQTANRIILPKSQIGSEVSQIQFTNTGKQMVRADIEAADQASPSTGDNNGFIRTCFTLIGFSAIILAAGKNRKSSSR